MHSRKKTNRFKVIRLNKYFFAFLKIILFLIILPVFLSGIHLKTELTDNLMKIALKNEISVFSVDNTVFNIFNYLCTELILGDTIPSLDFGEDAQNDEFIIPPPQPEVIQEQQIPENTFPIVDRQIVAENLEIRNETTYLPDIESLLYSTLSFDSPEILIVHTHATESYKNDNSNYYYESDSDRTTDTNYNVVRVGDELAKQLESYGYKVTHARNINDYPSYNQSYNKTLEVINYHLKQNPKIQIVIDVHRDSVVKSDGTKSKFTAGINGKKAAQVMLVCGTNQAGLENDTWQENLKFALKLQNHMENNFPGLARPLNLRQERFNTHATVGSFIIEVGTSGNTLNEALNSVYFLAMSINDVLLPYK